MPDTLAYSRVQEEPHDGPPEFIGTYCAHGVPLDDDSPPSDGGCEVRAILAHLDALTAAVNGAIFDLPIGVNVDYSRGYSAAIAASRAAVLAILRGEQ